MAEGQAGSESVVQTLVAAIEADTRGRDDFTDATRDMASAARQLQADVKKAGDAIAAMQRPIVQFRSIIMGLAGGFSLGNVIREVVAFETAMSKLTLAGELTAVQTEMVRNNIAGLAATTNNSVTDIATGMTALVKAGFNAAEAVGNIAPAMALADATATDLASTANILARTLQAFGRSASDSAAVADVLAVAVKKSGAGLQEIGYALKLTAPVARSYGVSLEETSVALGMMSKASGSAMRSQMALTQLLGIAGRETEQIQKKLKAWGLSVNELRDALGKPDGLVEVVKKLRDAGVDAAKMQDVLGSRTVGIVMPLIQQAEAFEKNVKAAKNATGAAEEYARIMNDNIKGDAKEAQAAISALALSIGDSGLGAALRVSLQSVTAFVRGLMGVVTEVGKANTIVRVFNLAGTTLAGNFERLADVVTVFGAVYTANVVRAVASSSTTFMGLRVVLAGAATWFRQARVEMVAYELAQRGLALGSAAATAAVGGMTGAVITLKAAASTAAFGVGALYTAIGGLPGVIALLVSGFIAFNTTITDSNESLDETRGRVANAAVEFDRLTAASKKLTLQKQVEELQKFADKVDFADAKFKAFSSVKTMDDYTAATLRYGSAWQKIVAALSVVGAGGGTALSDVQVSTAETERLTTEYKAALEGVSEQFQQQLLLVQRNTAGLQYLAASRRGDTEAAAKWAAEIKRAEEGINLLGAAMANATNNADQMERITSQRVQSLVSIIEKGNPQLAARRQQQRVIDDFESVMAMSGADLEKLNTKLAEYGYTVEEVQASVGRLRQVWALEAMDAAESADIYRKYRDELAQIKGSLSPIIGIERQRSDGLKQLSKLARVLGVDHEELVYWQEQLNAKYDEELQKVYGLLGPLDQLNNAFNRLKLSKEAVNKTELKASVTRDPAIDRALAKLTADTAVQPVRVKVTADTAEASETVQAFAQELNTKLVAPPVIAVDANTQPAVDAVMVVESKLAELGKTYTIDVQGGASIGELSRALIDAGIPAADLSRYLDDLGLSIDVTSEEFRYFETDVLPKVQGALGGVVRQYNEAEMASDDLRKTQEGLISLLATYKALQQSTSPVAQERVELLEAMGFGETNLTRAIEGTTLALAVQAKQIEFNNSELGKILRKYAEAEALDPGKSVRQQFDPSGERARELQNELNKAREILTKIEQSSTGALDGLTAPAVRRRIAELERDLKRANRELKLGGGDAAKAVEAAWERAAENINDAFLNLFKSLFRGVDDFKDALIDTFKTTVAQIAASALNETIVMPIVVKIKEVIADKLADFLGGIFNNNGGAGGGVGGGVFGKVIDTFGGAVKQIVKTINGNGAGAAGAAGGSLGGSLVSSLTSVGASLTKFAGTALAFGKAYLATFTSAGSTISGTIGGATAAGGLGAGAAAAAAYATPVLIGAGVGDYFGQRLGGQRGNINAGIGVGGVAGGFAGGALLGAKFGSWAGPIGAAIGALVGGLAAGLVGGNKTNVGSGVRLSYSDELGVTGDNYYIEKTRKNFGQSDKRVFRYSEFDEDYAASVEDALSAPFQKLKSVAESLNLSTDAIDNFTFSDRIVDLSGLSEEDAAKKIEDWLSSVTVSAIEQFVENTEGVPEALARNLKRFQTKDETVGAWIAENEQYVRELGGKTEKFLRSVAGQSIDDVVDMVGSWDPSATRDFLSRSLENFLLDARDGWTAEYIKAFETFAFLESIIATDPLETVDKARLEAAKTGTEAYADLVETMMGSLDGFDGSIKSGEKLVEAFYAVREAQITLIAQLYETRDAMLSAFTDTQQSIRESLMSPEELYGYRSARVSEIGQLLQTETDPGKLTALSTEANNLIQQLYGSLDETQQAGMAEGFIKTLDDLKALVERQTQIGIDSISAESTALNERVTAEMLAVAENQGRHVDEFGNHVGTFGDSIGLLERVLSRYLDSTRTPSAIQRTATPTPKAELGY